LNAEILALLTARTLDLGHVPGGRPELTGLDIAAALGMDHDPISADLLLAKYAANPKAYASGRIWWRMAVGDESIRARWDRKPAGTTFALADFSLDEWISSGRCTSCHGAAHAVIDHKPVECPACLGTGLERRSGRAAARGIGLPESTYRGSHWPLRLDWCRRRLWQIEADALSRLARRLTSAQQEAHYS
jgi:hypothetical protein